MLGAGLLAAIGGAAFIYFYVLRDLPDIKSLSDYRPPLTTTVLDRKGRTIAEFYDERRELTPLDQVPKIVIDAFLAAEDDSFFQHSGVDFRSMLRAAWANLRHGGETVQGASTITQQTVKQLLLTPERTYRRKIREIVLAERLERRLTKDQILYLYLNQTYFGSGAYGIGEAARTYFNKDISKVDVAEAALLAGLPKAPSRYSPFQNPKDAEQRRDYVLDRMKQEGFIDQETWRKARDHPPKLAEPDTTAADACAYFTEEVRQALVARLGNDAVLHGGLVVQTPLNLELQEAAVASVRDGLTTLDRREGWRGPQRHVARKEISDEIQQLADQNGVKAQPEAGSGPGILFGAGPWLAVVTRVDSRKQRVRVALAPGIEGEIPLDQVSWAHPVDPTAWPQPVKNIAQIFSVGDVVKVSLADPASAVPAPESPQLPQPDEALPKAPPKPPQGPLALTLYQEPAVQGSLLSFDVRNGDVLALVGGYDFHDSQFDRAVQAERQPGSAFKPIIYGTALGKGYTPASIVYDRPVVYENTDSGFVWRPHNYENRFLGPLTLIEALARSVNNASIHLLKDVGVRDVIQFARKLGIQSPLEPNLAMALGVNPVTLLELTRAYAVFASNGHMVHPIIIDRVLDRDGNVILRNVTLDGSAPDAQASSDADQQAPPAEAATPQPAQSANAAGTPAPDGGGPPQVIPATQAYLTSSLLQDVVALPFGTGRKAQSLHRPLAGKTGTTNDQGDAWFVGFSPEVATGVWVGFDEKHVLGRGETGARAALPIWMDYMKAALAGRPVRGFPVPDGIVFAKIDAKTGLLASHDSKIPIFQAFLRGTAPTERADTAENQNQSRRRLRLDF